MNIDIVWDGTALRGDRQVTPAGRTSTGNLLRTAVIISLFTDRRAQPDWIPPDRNSNDPRGWYWDTFGILIGSRLWQLRRRKIANRNALLLEARDMIQEALQWLKDQNLVSEIKINVQSAGSLLAFNVQLAQPMGPLPLIRLLWSPV